LAITPSLPQQPIKQQFEGRTSYAMSLFRDMLHSTKPIIFS